LKLLLAGATGLVGHLLLDRLQAMPDVEQIDCFVRRPLEGAGPKVRQHVSPNEDWPGQIADLSPDVALCALGTTMKQAGSAEAFKAVDHDAILCFARAARAAGARQMIMVSSVGAHQQSRNHYLSVKGQAEAGLRLVGFDRLDIIRPGLLRGKRKGDVRLGERIAMALSPVTDFLTPAVLDHYRSTRACDVAVAMTALTGKVEQGVFLHENRDIAAVLAG